MWHYSNAQRFRPPVPLAPPGAQSTLDMVMGLKGMPTVLLVPAAGSTSGEPGTTVTEVPGFIEEVSAACLTIGLAAPLPALGRQTCLGVEVLAGAGIVHFQTTVIHPVLMGETRLEVALPRQVETVQRRMFSRIPVTVQVVFTRMPGAGDGIGSDADSSEVNGLGQTLDLSAGGLRLVTQTPLRPGHRLFLSFTLSDGAAFRGVAARVVRARHDEGRWTAALSFSDLSSQMEGDLIQALSRLQLRNPALR